MRSFSGVLFDRPAITFDPARFRPDVANDRLVEQRACS
jgi:hypothetical protein